MSITIMSLVFAHNMPNLKTDVGVNVPDSTAKFVLLALADHCNDDGEAAYPSLTTLCKKTSMSRGTVCNALNALKLAGYTTFEGESKHHTSNYSLSIEILKTSPTTEPVQPPNFAKSSHRTLQSSATEHEPSIKPSLNQSTTTANSEVFKSYEAEIGVITPKIADTINDMIDNLRYPPEWIIESFQIASLQQKRNLPYCSAILKRWAIEGKDAGIPPKKPYTPYQKVPRGESFYDKVMRS